MKKQVFLLSLLSLSLFNCGNNPGPEPTIYHTIKFVGTDCEMHDENEASIVEKQFEAGQTASYHLVGKTEKYEIPKKNNVDITYTETGDPFDGIFSYNQDNGALSIKMTADVTITARSEEKIDHYFVTEEQFYKAMSFEGVTYAQFNILEDDGQSAAIIREDAEFAPGKFHLESHNFKKTQAQTHNCDIYVTKEEDSNPIVITYKRYQPLFDKDLFGSDPYNCLAYSDDAWEAVQASESEFKTPQTYIQFKKVTYDASAYDKLTHFFVIDGNYYQFENEKLRVVRYTDDNLTINIRYDEEDIILPDVSNPTYTVKESIWESETTNMINFTGEGIRTFYFNRLGETSSFTYDPDLIRYRSYEYFPSGYGGLQNATWVDLYGFYESSDNYYYLYSNDGSGWKFNMKTTNKDTWLADSTFTPVRIEQTMPNQFNKYKFDAENTYKATFEIGDKITVSAKFINGKLIYHSSDSYIKTFWKNTYIEVPADLPDPK